MWLGAQCRWCSLASGHCQSQLEGFRRTGLNCATVEFVPGNYSPWKERLFILWHVGEEPAGRFRPWAWTEVHSQSCGKWQRNATLGGTETLAVTPTILLGSKITVS